MPEYKPYTFKYHYLDETLKQIEAAIYTVVAPLEIEAWRTPEPTPFAERTAGEHLSLAPGDSWGGLFDCAWFQFTGRVPEQAGVEPHVLLLDVSGEMCVFDPDGTPVRGLTSLSSTYDFSLGGPGKRVLPLDPGAQDGAGIEVWADAGCNDLFGNLQDEGRVKVAAIATVHEAVRALYYDFEVLLDFLKTLPEESPRYQQVLTGLTDAMHLLYGGVPQNARRARAVLAPLLARRNGDAALQVSAVGHAHMDLAWLWPIRETIRKGARTFATALANIEKYPDYVFGASQAQYFAWMKQHYPALWKRIVAAVAAGRIDVQGCMWVEADTNVSGGEALVRQTLYGRRFWRREFGLDVNYLWLPDVFGYSGSLPGILAKAGVKYFSTQKLSWSLVNVFPHHSFRWRGIDGSEVLAHMLPEETYNSPAAPRSVRMIERNYKDSGVSSHALMVYGIGDGGGGPGEEHLERLTRIKNLEGLSPVTQEPVAAFLEKWQADAARFATWVGELYLERHEGTLTTNARNKRYNRTMELALRDLEWSSVLAGRTTGAAYPADRLEALWQETLLYQFHDILPGSSIKRVYDESVARYEVMLAETQELIAANDARIAAQVDTAEMAAPLLVFNPLSWERVEWVEAGGKWVKVTTPGMGYAAVDVGAAPAAPASSVRSGGFSRSVEAATTHGVRATADEIENDVLRVRFGEDGAIVSILDKRGSREVIRPGAAANRLGVYADLGDAWDFPMDYAEQTPRYMELVSSGARVDGPRAIMAQAYRLGHSEVTQEITLTVGSARLDFVTHLHWREPRSMLRTSFPVAVQADEATYEIQFGHLSRPTHRNTTWDLARDEVAAHRWADLSQRDYGVALLNDCKYGHKIKEGVMDLNLLRSAPYSGPRLVEDADVAPGEPHDGYTDQCEHDLIYALLPHAGDHVAGDVVRQAYALNAPLRVAGTGAHAGSLPRASSLLTVDAANVLVEAVKKAEDGDDVVVRLYECEGREAQAVVRFGFPVAAVSAVDLMEENPAPLAVENDAVGMHFGPFEIITLRVTPG
jgi:alpha-mannosidase